MTTRRLLLLLAFHLPAGGMTIRSFNASDHNRFTGFPSTPVMNPEFIYDATKFTGVGWFVSGVHRQGALVSPRHFVWATHHHLPGHASLDVLLQTLRFVGSDGVVVSRTVSAFTPIQDGSGDNTDLALVTLSSPLPATVKPFPWLNLGDEASYVNQELIVLGFNARGGRGAIRSFQTFDLDEGGPQGDTRLYDFEYDPASGGDDDCYLEPGDSGSPTFAMAASEAALVGLHSSVSSPEPTIVNYDTFIPHYIAELDLLLAPSGHRMAPVNFTATTLGIPSASASPGTLRRSHPGEISFSVGNTGAELTGNLAVTVTFPPGQQPSSLSAPGWVVDSGGSGIWNLRAATLAGGASLAFTATWTDLPDLPAINPVISADSDTAPAVLANPSFILAPSYAEWAEGLALSGQTDDPDGDGVENLLEYAFGGDPESGAISLPGGHPLLPVMTHHGGTVTLSYPERDDAVLRGLSYVVETSASPATLAGATTLPAGASSTTAPFSPAVPGFVKRTLTWPADGPQRFARVKVALAE
jgi:hypothetical protein